MRRCVALALFFSLFTTSALGAEKGGKKGKKGKKEEPPAGPSMDRTAQDPIAGERSDKGPYRPRGKTGELREKAVPEEEEVFRARPRDKAILFGDVIFGFGKSPMPGPAIQNQTRSVTVLALQVGGVYDFSADFTLGLRVPLSLGSEKLESGLTSESKIALGAPEVFGEYRIGLSERTSVPILFGVAAPIAQGQPDRSSSEIEGYKVARVNMVADSAGGWRDGELYWPKRLPVVIGLGIRHERKALELHAYSKLVTAFDVGTELADPRVFGGSADGHLVVHSIAFRNVTLAGLTFEFLKKPVLWVGLDTWLVYDAIEAIRFESNAKPPSPLQLVAEPRVGARFGKFRPSVGFILPIGGRLADAGMAAVHARADLAF